MSKAKAPSKSKLRDPSNGKLHDSSKSKLQKNTSKLCTENLFLLEFLVDDLNLEPRCDCMNPGEICVCFQFLDNEPLNVCEEDFNGGNKFSEMCFKTGKSCLFSLTPEQTKEVLKKFDVVVGVFKKMPLGVQPDKVCIGATKVSILELFHDLMKSEVDTALCAKVLKDTYTLCDEKRAQVGKITVYIRLSCYGKTIVTQFQMNMEDKSVLFKDKDGHSLYRYKKSKKGKATRIEDLSVPDCSQPTDCPNPQVQLYQQQLAEMQQCPPPGNPFCPQQPCYPPAPTMSQNMYGPGMGMGMMGMGGPGMMGMGMGMGAPGMMAGPSMYPPPNPNCPNQPCFPPTNYGQDDCPVAGKPCQQVSFAAPSGGCGGGCGRRC